MNVFFSLASGSGAAPSVAATSALWARDRKSRRFRYECPRHSALHARKKQLQLVRFYRIFFKTTAHHTLCSFEFSHFWIRLGLGLGVLLESRVISAFGGSSVRVQRWWSTGLMVLCLHNRTVLERFRVLCVSSALVDTPAADLSSATNRRSV